MTTDSRIFWALIGLCGEGFCIMLVGIDIRDELRRIAKFLEGRRK